MRLPTLCLENDPASQGATIGEQGGLTMMETAARTGHRGHSTNLVGVPTGLLASTAFNDAAPTLHLAGVRDSHHGQCALLARTPSAEQAGAVFQDYMSVVFGLHPEQQIAACDAGGRRRYRSR